jgi:hypothetical protein
VPLLITATARDPLAGHLGLAFAHLASHPGDAGPVNAVEERADSDALSFGASEYLGAPGRQIRVVRTAARAEGLEQTVILLHAPGSSAAALESLATAGTTLVAIGSSAPVAIELAADLARHTRVVLLEAWHLVRDSRLFSPWFRRGPAGIRPGEPDLDDAHIHRDVRDLLRANGAWQALVRDALGYRHDRGATRGPGIIRLEQAPQNWADVLAPGHAGNRPAS